MAETGRGGMPRIAAKVAWDEKAARKPSAYWGCWDCGFEDSYVRDVDRDDQHIRVRRRMCTRCGSMWETEERRIARGSYFGRAETRRYRAFVKSRYRSRQCLVCKQRYMAGSYKEHTEESAAHRKAVKRREERKHRRQLRYRRMWMRAKREVERANRRPGTCKRCGGEYVIGQWKAHARQLRHQSIVHEERNARRRLEKAPLRVAENAA